MTIDVTLTIDPEKESIHIKSEYALVFYSVWNSMMMKAKREECRDIAQMLEDSLYPTDPDSLWELLATLRERGREDIQGEDAA